jgi:acid phosphatase
MDGNRRFLLLVLVPLLLFAAGCDLQLVELIPAFSDYVKTPGTDYLEFIAVGDAGKGTADQYAVGEAMADYALSNPVQFVVLLGDNFYNSGVSSTWDPQWQTKFENAYDPLALGMPFYPILGNHDYAGNETAQVDYVSPNGDRWQMPARYYKVSRLLPDGTKIDLFFLDMVAFATEPAQQSWFDSELGASGARWKIVSGHFPVYSNGGYGDNPQLLALLKPMLDGRADVYLAGHEHDLQILAPDSGVSYLVDGTGAEVRDSGVGPNTVFAAGRLGFMAFLISANDLACRVIDHQGNLVYCAVLKSK